MKKFFAVIGIVVIASCQTDKKEESSSSGKNGQCDCSIVEEKDYQRGPRFANGKDNVNEMTWKKFTHDSVRLKVTEINLLDYDTVPEKFKIFENVEKVNISSRGITGLDIFPKLIEVEIKEGKVKFDTTEKWLGNIKILSTRKTRIEQLTSFRPFKSLAHLKLVNAEFDKFPSDLASLKCLNELELRGYIGSLNLSTIDLSKFSCLKKASFQSDEENMTGIPTGLSDTTKMTYLRVSHQKITEDEKKQIRSYNRKSRKDDEKTIEARRKKQIPSSSEN